MSYMRYMCFDGIKSLIHSAELTIVFDKWRVNYRRAVRGNPPEISFTELEDKYPGLMIKNRKFGIHIVTRDYIEKYNEGYLPLPLVITQLRLHRLLGRLRYAGVLAAPEWIEECLYGFNYQYDRGSELFARVIRYVEDNAESTDHDGDRVQQEEQHEDKNHFQREAEA
jgi:hypothetical protein